MDLRLPHVPPLWREGLYALEAATLLSSSVWRGVGVPRGNGDPVLLIPGLLAGDGSLSLLTRWLRERGYHTKRAGIRSNVDCSAGAVARLEERVEHLAEASGRRVALIGQSRGGVFAKSIAVRRPDLVSGVVALGSPLKSQLAIHPVVLGGVIALGALGTARVAGLFRRECLSGECCRDFRETVASDLPAHVGFVSIYSRRDGIVNWRACLDPAADECVEIRGASHCGMSANADAFDVIARALVRFRDEQVWPPAGWAQAA